MKHFYNAFKRLTAVSLSALLIAAAPLSHATTTLEDMQGQQETLSQQKADLQEQIDSLASEEALKEERQALLSEQIKTVEQQIDTAIENISTLNDSITSLEKEIKKSEKEIEDTMELLKKRLAALYSAGKVSTLEILFDSESLHDFSVRTELISSVTKHDRALILKVSDYMEKTEAQRNDLEKQKTTLADEKKLLESSQSELLTLEEENNALLSEIRTKKGNAESELQRTQEEADALSGQISYLIEQMKAQEEASKPTPTPEPTPVPDPDPDESDNTDGTDNSDESGNTDPAPNPDPTPEPTPEPPAPDYSGEGFAWPVPGYSTVTCAFGNGHYGMDIGAPHGTPIVASRSGTVMVANDSDDWGYSWGYYVSIYHDSTYSTLYAHMSSVAVTEGQWVNQGDVIGYVGNTGYSFGNHLHFEVYQDGYRVDPSAFV